MVKRKRSYVPKSRKRTKRRSSSRYKITTLIPKTKMVSLKYSGSFTLADGDGSAGHLIRCNGMNDPDYTGVGHQPMGFDNWMAFYHHYEVFSSKITFWIEAPGAGVSSGTYATLRIDSDTASPDETLDASMERVGTVVRYLHPPQGGGRVMVKKSFNANSIFGKNQRGNSVMKGSPTTDPAEASFFRLRLVNSKIGVASLYTHTVVFTITYLALLTERKDIAQS